MKQTHPDRGGSFALFAEFFLQAGDVSVDHIGGFAGGEIPLGFKQMKLLREIQWRRLWNGSTVG